jgi:tRNA(adenine34) deaminase
MTKKIGEDEQVDVEQDRFFMEAAMAAARDAAAAGDIPIGAVVVRDGAIIARVGNARRIDKDPTGHSEIRALQAAARVVGDWRLLGCTLYVTLEPCVMCAGALVLSRVDRVVYAAADPKAGAVESLYRILDDRRLNHQPRVTGGVLAEEAGAMLTSFFRARRGGRVVEGA